MEHYRKLVQLLETRMQVIAPIRQVEYLALKIDELENRLRKILRDAIAKQRERLTLAAQKLQEYSPRNRFCLGRQQLDSYRHRLRKSTQVTLDASGEQLRQLEKRLLNNSLQSTLKRGYALLKNDRGAILGNTQKARREKQILAHFHDGVLPLSVEAAPQKIGEITHKL